MGSARALLLTLRPHQWVKNLFVAAPLVFSKELTDPRSATLAALAVLAFCALSGAVYAINDVADIEKDRAHPIKKDRPVASGALSPERAISAAILLATLAIGFAFFLDVRFGAVAAGYLLLNLGYSFQLKHVAFLDVASISGGFLLRVLGGAYAISVPASPWLLACTGLLAAFLAFGKRAHELALAQRATSGGGPGKTRSVLGRYRRGHLHVALYVLAAATSAAYVFYTQAPHTVEFFGTRAMIWTAPFCALGIARFVWLVVKRPDGDSPTEEMLRDWPFVLNLAVWGLVVLGIIYTR